ncbi:MAG TPA: family 43 glycosylhydrolase [Microbacterium sp.]|nr:family 43 glycosylhydrolase [Microbacterium sp.]
MSAATDTTTPGAPDAAIVNGVTWFDDRGRPVNAHGGCIVEESGRYYLFGEYKTDDENRFIGFSCYSSPDLVTWTFERLVLGPQPDGLLGPDRIGERVKVMKCPKTGRFTMFMHTDDLTYTDAVIGRASSDTIAGDYEFHGALTHDGEPVEGWDMGTFQDDDGTGYLVLHEGDIFTLSPDYSEVRERIAHHIAPGGESPAMFRDGDRYFLMFSHKTSWERNDNYHLSAPAPGGPWSYRGAIAARGTLTHNSQCTFVLTRHEASGPAHMYMGDRWSFPRQASAATYVWLPLEVRGDTVAPLDYLPAWSPATGGRAELSGEASCREVCFVTRTPGATEEIPFEGSRIGLVGRSDPHGGYARVEIVDATTSRPLADGLVDFYSKVADDGWRYLSPPLPPGPKRMLIRNAGEYPVWFNKAGDRFGSDDTRVHVTRVCVFD